MEMCFNKHLQCTCCTPVETESSKHGVTLTPMEDLYSWVWFSYYWLIGNNLLCSRSLERRLQRPILAKSRTLPSIPQSPAAVRGQQSENACVQQQRARLPSSPGPVEACTLPSAGIVLASKHVYQTFCVLLNKFLTLVLCFAKAICSNKVSSVL